MHANFPTMMSVGGCMRNKGVLHRQGGGELQGGELEQDHREWDSRGLVPCAEQCSGCVVAWLPVHVPRGLHITVCSCLGGVCKDKKMLLTQFDDRDPGWMQSAYRVAAPWTCCIVLMLLTFTLNLTSCVFALLALYCHSSMTGRRLQQSRTRKTP